MGIIKESALPSKSSVAAPDLIRVLDSEDNNNSKYVTKTVLENSFPSSELIESIETGNFTADGENLTLYILEGSSATATATLPDLATNVGKTLYFKNNDFDSGYELIISRAGSDTIQGNTTETISTQNG